MNNKLIYINSICDNSNFGNRLQNYALLRTIKNLGFDCRNYNRSFSTGIYSKKDYIKYLLGLIGVKRYRYNFLLVNRIKTISGFTNNKIKNLEADTKESENAIYITGSDQVWHRWGTASELREYYLPFAPKGKRISYAPSFGFSKFPPNDLLIHKEGLEGIDYLSCREQSMIPMIKELTGRDAVYVLDPTLLVDAHHWRSIEQCPKYNLPDRYVIVNFLGACEAEPEKYIEAYCKKNNCKIIDLKSNEKVYCNTLPENFIFLIEHAQAVFTDSFHCCVFSVTFHRPFIAFERSEPGVEDMFDRIFSLLSLCGLEDRIFSLETSLDIPDADYNEVDRILSLERDKSVEWLKDSIEGAFARESTH